MGSRSAVSRILAGCRQIPGGGMTFKRFVCWDSDQVLRVMDTEALQPPKHIFLATHHPSLMYRQDFANPNARREYDEESFLRDFLSPHDFAFVPVLGAAGTGKSHLIRWLEARIEPGP